MGQKLITPNKITKLKKNEIFVFGSNLAGIHGAGAALLAKNEFKAEPGVGEGLTGQCYALPTKDFNIVSRSIADIVNSVQTLITTIKLNPEKTFLITEIGCGLAGFKQSEIAPLFTELYNSDLENYSLPQTFFDILTPKTLTRGYKVTDANMKCRGYQYELNKIYTHTGSVRPCLSGFHYCEQAVDCFEYYSFTSDNRVFEIIDHGKSVKEGDKTCTSSIEFIRELSWTEVQCLVNTGKDNIGRRNSGNSNSGDRNSGDRNSGAFCTEANPKLVLFDKECDITVREWEQTRICQIMYNLNPNIWIWSNEMTDKEKKEFPTHETTGGYLKSISHKEAWTNLWGNLNDSDKKLFLDLPNFDAKKFKEITGIII